MKSAPIGTGTSPLAHVVGVVMAGLTLVLPLLAIMNYSSSSPQSNPSLLLPVDTSVQP
ncbi:MAG: hypothetical protein VKJ85_13830 [Prochlorothrix sp.]|nr:hypothetical protein [Prochlorothrix sp.]